MPAAKSSMTPLRPSQSVLAKPGDSASSAAKARQLFVDNLALVRQLVSVVCRRGGLNDADAEDFASEVFLKLIGDDYRALRQFRGRAKLSTYLATLIQHELRDFRIRRWGRWRPSAQAKRLGQVAVELETLLARDGHTLGMAIEILAARSAGCSRTELERLAARLPPRTKRRLEGEETLARMAVDGDVERRLIESRCRPQGAALRRVLGAALNRIPVEDQTMLSLHYEKGMTLQAVAAAMDLEPRRLYRRRERCLRALRRACEEAGLTWQTVNEIVRSGELELHLSSSHIASIAPAVL